ncbi:MAG: DUF370 domain-containing protein [Oscillospiraceae bacterium]
MYLHLGEDVIINDKDIVGIFDLEKCSLKKETKSFLSASTKNKNVINVSYKMPKSFILTNIKNKGTSENHLYISQISTQTLRKRFIGQKSK